MSITFKTTGIPQLIAALKRGGDNIAVKHMRKAFQAGVGLIQNAARSRVPVKTGRLAAGIRSRVTVKGKTQVIGKVGARGGNLTEYGTKERRTKRQRTGRMPRRPWMGPAFDAVEPRVVSEIERELEAAVGDLGK